MAEIPWHTMKISEVIKNLDTDINTGISQIDAENKIQKYGYNQLEKKRDVSHFLIFLGQFNNFIVWILIAAALLSGVLKELDDAIAIIVIVVMNAIIAFIQEYRAEKSLATLQKMSVPFSKIIRNGEVKSIPSYDIVPGDIVLLEAGDSIPADGRLCSLFSLRVQEASLTGESTPVSKSTEALTNPSLPIGDRKNMVFMGTSVTGGKGTYIVVSTGMQTELGKIAGIIQKVGAKETSLQIKLQTFGKKLVYLGLGIVTIVFLLELWRKDPLLEAFLMSISLAVAAIPEGLPAIVTIALALGAQRMVKRHVLIRKLSAVETLGCITAICTDKTGTLTQNEMTVRKIYVNGKIIDVSGTGYAPEGNFSIDGSPLSETDQKAIRKTLEIGTLCNNAYLKKDDNTWRIIGDPTEGAILCVAAKVNIWKEYLEKQYPLISEIPFDSERKKMSTIRGISPASFVYEKGAPDVILKDCTRIYVEGVIRDLTKDDIRIILYENSQMAENALRILGMAFKPIDRDGTNLTSDIEKDMIFAGLIAMIDPPRPEVKDAVATCRRAGIRTVMITGDHKNTARAIGEELGILTKNLKAVDGVELDILSDETLEKEVQKIAVYARVSAEHKLRIVKAWKKHNAIVAVTGDGINDAPAIKEADVGISMGITGTDLTKETSDMVITNDNFTSIVAAVKEGRGIYDNIKKSIHYLLSCNAGEILTMLFISVFNLPIPFLPIQILWMNIVTDGLPALALGIDIVDPDIMKGPSRRPTKQIIDRNLGILIILQGFLIALSTILAYLCALYYTSNGESGNLHSWILNELIPCCSGGTLKSDLDRARTVAFCVLVISQLFHSFNCRNVKRPLSEIGAFANKKLLVGNGISFAMQATIVSIPYFRDIFKVVPLGLKDWIIIFVFSSLTFFITDVIKSLKEKYNTFTKQGE